MKQKLLLKPKTRRIHVGDVLKVLSKFPSRSINCIMTSPMYYNSVTHGTPGEWGSENSLFEFLYKMRILQNELYRILKPSGCCFINISDSYANRNHGGIKKGSKLKVPERFSTQAVDDGWIEENAIIWLKRNAPPTSVKSHLWWNFEPVYFWVKKKPGHYFNLKAIKIPRTTKNKPYNWRVRDAAAGKLKKRFGEKFKASKKEIKKFKQDQRNRADYTGFNSRYNPIGDGKKNPGCLLDITQKSSGTNHMATYPIEFAEWFIKCGCPKNGIILDPFIGSGSTAIAAENLNRKWIGIELSRKFANEAIKRIGVGRII